MIQEENKNTLLPNLLGVLNYLQDHGWKVSRSAIYIHRKEGKIRPAKDGNFRIKDVEKYAATFLKRKDGSDLMEDSGQLQRKKLEAEMIKVQAQAEHWELKTKVAKGLYIERIAYERDLATRAMIFKSDLTNFFRSQAPRMTTLVEGNQLKIPDLIDFMLEQIEDWMNRYAEEREFRLDRP